MICKAINGIKYWFQIFLLPVYWLSFLIPRSRHIWLFGSTFGRRFADNPRYLYLYCSSQRENIRCEKGRKPLRPIWISRSRDIVKLLERRGYEAYYCHSFKGIWYCLRAKVYLYDNYSKDISFWLSGGAVKVNLWHGIPLKKIQADNMFDEIRHPENKWEAFKAFPRRLSDEKPSHYVLTTSEFMRPVFESAFRTKKVFLSGYPRIDGFVRPDFEQLYTENERKALDRIRAMLGNDKKMIYYMPTFRGSEDKFFDVINLEEFEAFLEGNHLIFCTKLHPKSKLQGKFQSIEGGNIINIEADTDPYAFIQASAALVTDYSSIYFDYLFADKPIIFFNYDYEEYLRDSRELYFDYDEFTPGAKAADQAALQRALLDVKNGMDAYAGQREMLRRRVFDKTDARACERLTADILQVI